MEITRTAITTNGAEAQQSQSDGQCEQDAKVAQTLLALPAPFNTEQYDSRDVLHICACWHIDDGPPIHHLYECHVMSMADE
jgi:hypothetical protein